MKHTFLVLVLLSCFQVTSATHNNLVSRQPRFSNTTILTLAATHLCDAYHDPLKEEATTAACLGVNGAKTCCFLLASDMISTEFSKRYCDDNPEARQVCNVITDWALLAACHECDKQFYPFPKRKLKKK